MSKAIKITKANSQKIVAALIDVQVPRVSARTIAVDTVFNEVAHIEKKLSLLLHKKDWVGIRVRVDFHAQTFPPSYRGRPESTHFTIQRTSTGWHLLHAVRGWCGPRVYEFTGLKEKANLIADFIEKNFF